MQALFGEHRLQKQPYDDDGNDDDDDDDDGGGSDDDDDDGDGDGDADDDGEDNLCWNKVSCRGARRLNPLPGCWLVHLQRIRLLCFDALMVATIMMIMLALEMTVMMMLVLSI